MTTTLIARPYTERKVIAITNRIKGTVQDLVRTLGAAGERSGASSSEAEADRKANVVIAQTMLIVAAAGAIPVFVNWFVFASLVGIGVVRIGRAYGASMTRKEARKLAFQFVKSAGITVACIFVFVQIMAGVAQASVVGYLLGAGIEATYFALMFLALGSWSKTHFREERRQKELERIFEVATEYRLWIRDTPLLIVDENGATELAFPIGHPRERTVYIGHPEVPRLYYPMAEFHFRLFEHKFCEALRLLRCLGATRFSVQHVSGHSHEWSERVSLGVAGAAVEQMTHGRERSASAALYKAEFDALERPTVPSDLVWFPRELTWQEVAAGRMEGRLREFDLSVALTDDMGVNQSLCATLGIPSGVLGVKVDGALNIGGKFEEHRTTSWRIAGSFR